MRLGSPEEGGDDLAAAQDRDVAVGRDFEHDLGGLRQGGGGGGASSFVLAVGARDDGAVGEEAAVAAEDGRPVAAWPPMAVAMAAARARGNVVQCSAWRIRIGRH